MENKNSITQKILKKIKSPNFVYLAVFFVFLAIVCFLFLYSTNFIITNINKIFSPTGNGDEQALNIENYSLVAKRLGFAANLPTKNAVVSPATIPLTTPSTSTSTTSITIKSVALSVLNSTSKRGVASTLATALKQVGFIKVTTGNQKKLATTTTILISNSARDFTTIVENVVKKTYPKSTTRVTDNAATAEITIIIGEN